MTLEKLWLSGKVGFLSLDIRRLWSISSWATNYCKTEIAPDLWRRLVLFMFANFFLPLVPSHLDRWVLFLALRTWNWGKTGFWKKFPDHAAGSPFTPSQNRLYTLRVLRICMYVADTRIGFKVLCMYSLTGLQKNETEICVFQSLFFFLLLCPGELMTDDILTGS